MKEIALLILLTFGLQAESYEKLQEACDAGGGESCMHLGILYQLGKEVDQSYEKANLYYTKACDMDDSEGCMNLADLYYLGQGIEQNITKAKIYYSKSCKLHNENGCSSLKTLEDDEEELKQKKDELERLKQEHDELIQEAEVLDNI